MKINLGCGKRNFGKDWIHIDGSKYPHIDSHDIINFHYTNIDLIYASHVIEYFDREEIVKILKIWKNKLKRNGILRIAVPDFKQINKLYLTKKFDLDSFLGPLYGKMTMNDKNIYHKTVYDFESLEKILLKSGFAKIRKWDWRKVNHGKFDDHSQAYLPKMNKEEGTLISLNIEASNE